ncbi:hypothetical protein pb186bvf_001910 [Paramecium bursaria]
MEIIYSNPSFIFSFAEITYLNKLQFKEDDFFDILETMEICQDKKDLSQLMEQYSNLLRHFIEINKENQILSITKNVNYISEDVYKRFQEDLTYLIELITNLHEKHSQQLPIMLNIYLSVLYLSLIKNKINIYNNIESQLLKLIQFSQRVNFIPIKKVMLIFFFQLSLELNEKLPSDGSYWLRTSDYKQALSKQPKINIPSSRTEKFYKRLISNQEEYSIVVGLLKAVAQTSGSMPHTQQGVDVHKEWDCFYQFDVQTPAYLKFKENSENFQELRAQKNEIIEEFDRQRIITNFIINQFFLLLLRKFRNNCKVQCSYLIQLITDAKGILGLLKFWERFNPALINATKQQCDQISELQLVERCIQNILKFLYITCNNFPDKIYTFLIDYKEYLAIKKFPGYFPDNKKIRKYSYLLLKIQVVNFPKKNLKLGNTMKIISEVYCKFKQDNNYSFKHENLLLDQLYKFEKQQDRIKLQTDTIADQQELRKIHLEYNNYHYWAAQKNNEEFVIKDSLYYTSLLNQPIPKDFIQNYEQWLEDNVWDYYD